MEISKLSFTTHEVNELIGGVPKKILWYCLGILLSTIIAVGSMISITPYPKNIIVQARIITSKNKSNLSGSDFLNKNNKNLICQLQFDLNQFNKFYLSHIKKVNITFLDVSGKYQFFGNILSVSTKGNYIFADAKITPNPNLQKFLITDSKLSQKLFTVELANDRFSIKDKLEASLW